MSTTYTWDVFSTLDGFGSYNSNGNWGGYWGKQGPELLKRRLATYADKQRVVLGPKTYQQFIQQLDSGTDGDEWVTRMLAMPATVVSTTLKGPSNWPGGVDIVNGNAVDIVAQLKKESTLPLRSHGSLSMNRALMAAGLVDHIQVTLFPVISGQTGEGPIFKDAADFDLKLIESRTLDGNIQELIYRPTLHI